MEPVAVLRENVALRLAQIQESLTSLCDQYSLDGRAVAGWLRYGNPSLRKLEELARILQVPVHVLLDPDFNPRDWDWNTGEAEEGEGDV